MEERSIGLIIERMIQLLFPDNSSPSPQVNDAKEKRLFDFVSYKYECSHDVRVCPAVRVWVGNVESRDGGHEYFVRGRWQCTSDDGFIFGEDGEGRHFVMSVLALERAKCV